MADESDLAAREAADIETVGRQALAEVREAVAGYRGRGLAAELDDARSALADAGIETAVRTSGTTLPAPTDTLFGWIAREGATNAIRHSRAKRCEISVLRREGEAVLEILDDGVGENGKGARPAAGCGGSPRGRPTPAAGSNPVPCRAAVSGSQSRYPSGEEAQTSEPAR